MNSTEERLREGIDQFTEGARVPAGLAARAVRRHHRRRAALRGGLGSSAVAAVAAVAVIATTGGGGAAPVETTAYVVAQVSRALSAPGVGNMVEEVSVPAQTVTGHGAHIAVEAADTWQYKGSSRANVYDSQGRLTEMLWGRSSVTVSERLHGWAVVPLMMWAMLPGPNGCIRPGNRYSNVLFFPTASFVRATLHCGGLAVAGHLRIGGEETIKLVSTGRATMISPVTMYVSPKTYLPVRVAAWGITANVHWLAPTPALLASLKTHIPAGFRRIGLREFLDANLWQRGLPNGTFAVPISPRA